MNLQLNKTPRHYRDPNKAIQQVMNTIDHLRQLYDSETQAIQDSRMNDFLSMQDRKLELAQKYQDDAQYLIKKGKDIKEKVDPKLRTQLESMEKEFSEAAHKNMEALQRMSRVMKRMHDRIMMAAKKSALTQSLQYGSTGKFGGEKQKVVTTGLSETA